MCQNLRGFQHHEWFRQIDIAMRNNKPAAFRGEASAGAVLRHDLHCVSDVQYVCIRQVSNINGSCCPQGRGANSERLAAKKRQSLRWRDSPRDRKPESSLSEDD